jgi:hypothetical protein
MSEEKKRVKFEDVVDALTKDAEGNDLAESINPFQTNAAKVREIIGSGGLGTIQKHLDKIRDDINSERMKELDSGKSEAPKAPKELVESLWAEAWMTAQVSTLSRIDSLNIEREGLLLKSNAQSNDIETLSNQVDNFEYQVTELESVIENNKLIVANLEADAERKIENLRVELTNENTDLENSKKALESALINLKHEIESVKKDAVHQKELSDRDAEIAKATMQVTIDNLTEQVSELKAMRIS